MEPESPHPLEGTLSAAEGLSAPATVQAPEPPGFSAPPEPYRGLRWIFIGGQGLRAGWSTLIFLALSFLFTPAVSFVFFKLHLLGAERRFTPTEQIFSELCVVLSILGAAAAVALIERRNIVDFNLRGPRRPRYFLSGLAAGFAALSVLVAALTAGGWMHFDAAALSGAAILRFGALWGLAFLLVGLAEEGMFRCYLQFTFTRGMNFWWALSVVVFVCALQAAKHDGDCALGVYAIAALGLVPCFILHRKIAAHSAFWQAAWATSTLFGLVHTGNGGENWIGVFAAASIGFVFCVSVRVTGSAWWAIGCHAAWDWAETFFYGTADSGMQGQGHLLSASPAGNPLWSGGADGPEGSLLVLGAILLLLVFLLAANGRRKEAALHAPTLLPEEKSA